MVNFPIFQLSSLPAFHKDENMKTWLTFILLTLFILTACAAPSSASPTPTIVRLDRSALTPTIQMQVADVLPPATATPSATPTQTPVATTTPAPATLQPEVQTTPSPMTTAPTEMAQAEIIATGLNVREGPGVSFVAIGTVVQGDILDIIGVSADGNWLQILTKDGKSGWISGQSAYTHILGSLDDVPVVEASPAGLPSSVSGQSSEMGGQPSVVAAGGKLVFATSSGGDLYVVNTECASLPEGCGTGLEKLASGVIDPVVSPDGTQVAFTRWDGASFGALYVLNLDDGSERVVASDIRQPKSPTWSQDGQEIIISFQHGGTVDPKPECREFDADDGMQLPNVSEITSVHRNSDGSIKICFIRLEDLQWGLRRINLTTSQFEDLPADLYSFNPTWDPQNSWRVIYDGQRGLMQLDVTTGDLQPFTNDVRDTAPVFSPDGQTLALTYKQHDHWEVYTYDLASGSRQRLTKPSMMADPQYSSAAPAWSPDDSQIAFVTDRSGRWEIWVMNADGSNQHPLFSSEVQAQLGLDYQGVNERLLNWID
jgi:Tol biopolymer transport system component